MTEKDFDLEARLERIETILSTIVDLADFDRGEVVIRSNRFLALNSTGQLRGCFGVNKESNKGAASLYLMDRGGDLAVCLTAATDRGGQLSLFAPDESLKVRIEVDPAGEGRVRAFSAEGKGQVITLPD